MYYEPYWRRFRDFRVRFVVFVGKTYGFRPFRPSDFRGLSSSMSWEAL